MADEQPNEPVTEAGTAPAPPSANTAPLPPIAQQYYPPLYPAGGQQEQQQSPPPLASIASTSQPPGGFPVFAPPVTTPYGTPYGPPPGYLELPVRPKRPGILTALAVTGIVLSVVGMFGAALTAIGATAFLVTGDTAAAAQVRKATDALTAPPDAPAPAVKASPGPKGMDERDRVTVMQALSQLETIQQDRLEQLDLILTLSGKAMFPKAGELLTVDAIQGMVTSHGELFTARVDAQGTGYFVTEGGRLELFDDRAVFRPSDGSPTVRVAANPPPPIGLTSEEVESVVSQVQIATKNALNTQQQASLRTLLLDPAQDVIPPNRLTSPVASTKGEGGVITLKFTGGAHSVSLGPQGEHLPPGAVPPPKVDRALFGCLIALAAISVGLAIYLFVGAVQMFRSKYAASARIMGRYAALKLVATIAIIALALWMRSDFVSRFTEALEAAGQTSVAPVLPIWAPRLIALAGLGLIYPIILLVVLRLRAVRAHVETKPQNRLF